MKGSEFWSLTGVVEGANHPPFEHEQRLDFIQWLSEQGYNAYIYASKFDRLQNEEWYKWLSWEQFRKLVHEFEYAHSCGMHYYYGLRMVHMPSDIDMAVEMAYHKLEPMVREGLKGVTILFDDMNDNRPDKHVEFCNKLYPLLDNHHPNGSFDMNVCPQAYHGDAEDNAGYLGWFADLFGPIDLFYTGPEVVSRRITESDCRKFANITNRGPLIWDNQFCDDLDLSPELGPLHGRDPGLWFQCSGWFANTTRDPEDMKRSLEYSSRYLKDPYGYYSSLTED